MDNQNNKYICQSCNIKCNCESAWNKHIATELHLFGKRKVRSDFNGPYICKACNFETKNNSHYKQHILNLHSTKEEREKGFKYYCKYCDYGTLSKSLINKHNLTVKHINFVEIFNNSKKLT